VRETTKGNAEDVEYEEWIYGEPPQDVDFVRFVGDEVVRVETMKVDGQKVVRVEKEVDLGEATVAKKQEGHPATAPRCAVPGRNAEANPANRSPMPPVAPPQPTGAMGRTLIGGLPEGRSFLSSAGHENRVTLYSCHPLRRLRNVTVNSRRRRGPMGPHRAARQDTSVSRLLGEVLKKRMSAQQGRQRWSGWRASAGVTNSLCVDSKSKI